MRHSSLLKVCPQRPLRVKCFTFQIHKPFYTHFLWYLTFSCSAKTTHLVKHIHLQIFSASIILVQNSPCKLNRYGIFLDFWCHYLQKRKTKIIMIQCWDYFMFLHRQLSKGRGAEWRILTSLPPYPGESLSGLHQTQRESIQGTHPQLCIQTQWLFLNQRMCNTLFKTNKTTQTHPPKKENELKSYYKFWAIIWINVSLCLVCSSKTAETCLDRTICERTEKSVLNWKWLTLLINEEIQIISDLS